MGYHGCDLLENSYLCGINNNRMSIVLQLRYVVICLKIRTFVVSTTTIMRVTFFVYSCDLLENSYLCGINNNTLILVAMLTRLWFAWKFVPLWYQQQLRFHQGNQRTVVICLKIRTFVVSTTTWPRETSKANMLWFAWKFVPLWYQQQLILSSNGVITGCDLLENSYLCGINNNLSWIISWLADSYKIVAQKNNWYYKMKSHSFRMGFFTLMTMQWRIIFKLL